LFEVLFLLGLLEMMLSRGPALLKDDEAFREAQYSKGWLSSTTEFTAEWSSCVSSIKS